MKNLATKLTAMSSVAMMLMPMTTFATVSETQNVGQTESDEATTKDTDVLYNQSSNYTVTIPKTIVLDGKTKTSDYTVNVKGDISSDKKVVVEPETSFNMVDQSTSANKKADVPATVTQSVTEWTSAEVCVANTGTTKNGNVSASGLSAGSWKGTFNFNIAMQDDGTLKLNPDFKKFTHDDLEEYFPIGGGGIVTAENREELFSLIPEDYTSYAVISSIGGSEDCYWFVFCDDNKACTYSLSSDDYPYILHNGEHSKYSYIKISRDGTVSQGVSTGVGSLYCNTNTLLTQSSKYLK